MATKRLQVINNLHGKDGKDGKDGYTPIKGVDYFDGADGKDGQNGSDGVSATHSWDGTVLTIKSASGESSADLKGEKGEKGDKGDTGLTGASGKDGSDYILTEADKQEIAQLVEVPEGGSGGGSGEWEVLTDITLAEDATVAEITYDSKYKELYGEIIMPKVPVEINTVNNCKFLGTPLYYVKIGSVTYSYVIQAYVNIVTEKTPFLICRVKEDSGAGMKAELVTRNGVQSLINEMRTCKFTIALPAGTTIKVYGRE